MVEINLWANKYTSLPPQRKEMQAEVKKDKEGFMKNTILALKQHIIS